MADGIVGQTITERFRTSAAGETFTITNATDPTGAAWAGPTITDLGSGTYRLSFAPAVEGVWEATLTGDTSGEVIVGEWEIVASGGVTIPTTTTTDLTTTRAELRRRIGRLLGDMLEVTATTTGSTTALTDTIRLGNQIDDPTHRDIVFVSAGSNFGVVRRILTANLTTGEITFAALPAAIAAGDEAHIFNRHSRGWTVPEYDDAINQAIDATWPVYKEPAVATLGVTFDPDSPLLTVPSAMTDVFYVEYEDANGLWQRIPGTSWVRYSATGELVVSGDTILTAMDGFDVRLIGATRPTPLASDDDTTTIRPDYLVYQAAAILCQNRYSRGQTDFYNPMLLNQQFADKFKPRSRNEGMAVRRL